MLSNQITVTDGTTPVTLDLISRSGMKSVRTDMSSDTSVAAKLTLDSTIPATGSTAKARHVAILNIKEEDGTTGVISETQVHAVISRDPALADSTVEYAVDLLANLLGQTDFVNQLIHGGN